VNFRSTQKLGSGQFGTVNKGVWQSPAGPVEVAVKTLKEGASEQDRVKFLQEAAISGQFHHRNVIELHGVVTVGEPTMIVLEFMSEGDLRAYLNEQSPW
jgi:serine/threonine protein kinase